MREPSRPFPGIRKGRNEGLVSSCLFLPPQRREEHIIKTFKTKQFEQTDAHRYCAHSLPYHLLDNSLFDYQRWRIGLVAHPGLEGEGGDATNCQREPNLPGLDENLAKFFHPTLINLAPTAEKEAPF